MQKLTLPLTAGGERYGRYPEDHAKTSQAAREWREKGIVRW